MKSPIQMARRRYPRALLICLLACCSALAIGCGSKKSTLTGPLPGPRYPDLTTPENTLLAMIRAYSSRDTVELGLVYDDAYAGTSIDTDEWAPVALNFTKADEIRHVATLAGDPSITKVSVNLNPIIKRYTDAADPPGTASLQNPIRSVEVEDGPTLYSVYLSYETLTYKLAPTTPASGSPTDTT
ncbi:MAG: hypothetical protein L3K06_05175, partial [Thermoplasmata archaeon]|nr:hypothetical protein [Thermoplasmata archaeon]